MKILVDAMGGDNAPDEIVKGAVEVADSVDATIVLIGDEKIIKDKLSAYESKKNIHIKHASERIYNEDKETRRPHARALFDYRGSEFYRLHGADVLFIQCLRSQ